MRSFLILILLALSFVSIKPQSPDLKNKFPQSEITNSLIIPVDSSVNPIQDSIPKFKKVTFGTIFFEIILAPTMGFLFTIPAAGLSLAAIQPQGEFGGLVIIPFMYLGYVVGSSFGTYLIAHKRNSEVSFWETIGFGLAGSGAAYGLFSMKKDRMLGTFELYSFLGLPILSEILYVNLLSPKGKTVSYQKTEIFQNYFSIKTHQDLYNSTLLYKIELFRINF